MPDQNPRQTRLHTAFADDQSGRPIRVLVVDDSAVQRGLLLALLEADPELEAAGWAADGADAVRAAARLRPDLIIMDLRMPMMDGLEATRRILEETPVPIVLVTASAVDGDQALLNRASEAGVLAVSAPPLPGPQGQPAAAQLLRTIKSMAQVRVVRRRPTGPLQPGLSPQQPAGATGPLPRPAGATGPLPRPPRPLVLAIGASTGGPQALQVILSRLPATFPLPILLVQHIAPGFDSGIVDWLRTQCLLPVQLATGGLRLVRPGIYVAPAGTHLTVRGRALALTTDLPVSGHRPSVTVLFRSVAVEYGAHAIGLLLTGMGDDGAAGLADMKRAGAATIAQDEASSVVFGMPAAALDLGVVDHVLPPDRIAPLLLQRCT